MTAPVVAVGDQALRGDNDADPDQFVCRSRARIARGQFGAVLTGSKRDQCIVDRTTRNSELTEQVGDPGGDLPAENQRCGKPIGQ